MGRLTRSAKKFKWFFAKPKEVTQEEVDLAEKEYEKAFAQWINSESGAEERACDALLPPLRNIEIVLWKNETIGNYTKYGLENKEWRLHRIVATAILL